VSLHGLPPFVHPAPAARRSARPARLPPWVPACTPAGIPARRSTHAGTPPALRSVRSPAPAASSARRSANAGPKGTRTPFSTGDNPAKALSCVHLAVTVLLQTVHHTW